jgi:phage-related protein
LEASEWTVEYYEAASGESVVEEEMKAFGPKVFARLLRTIDLLQEFGLELGAEYIGHVKGKIWELRASRYRVLYFAFTGRRFVLLRTFMKKTKTVPDREIAIAESRLKDYVARTVTAQMGKGGAKA